MTPPIRVPKGLAGVAVAESSIAKSDPDGSLVYRGYSIGDLAENATLEEVAYLILIGSLPKRDELEAFSSGLKSSMKLDSRILDVLRTLPRESHPIDVLRTAVSALGSTDKQSSPREIELSIAAKVALLASDCYRIPQGEKPAEPKDNLSFAANLLNMTSERVPDQFDIWVFERLLIFYMEHDLNASSYTVRVVASTLADRYSAVTAGLAALKGPLHGGANEASMMMLEKLGGPENVGPYVEKEFSEGRKVAGFGHRVYKTFDPRARLCKEYLREMVVRRGTGERLFNLCDALETEMWQRKKIAPNLDFYAAPIFYSLGIPVPLYTPIFAAGRVFGWLAHYDEQVADNKLIRPDAEYIGPMDLKYVPIQDR